MFFGKRKGLLYEDPAKPGLRRRILNTVLFVLGFRLLANIPLANVNEEKLHELLAQNPLLGAIDLFAGGDVLKGFSVVAVGLFPYLLAAGIVRLAALAVPALRSLQKDSEEERFKLYTRMVTVPLAFVLAFGITRYLSRETGLFPAHLRWFTRSTFLSTAVVMVIMTLGSWLTEKIKDWITHHGIGEGESVILLVGSSLTLITRIHGQAFAPSAQTAEPGSLWRDAVVALVVIVISIPLLTVERRIPMTLVARAGRPKGNVPGPFLPLKLVAGGTTPISSAVGFIFLFQIAAMGLAWAFPGHLEGLQSLLLAPTRPEHVIYWTLLFGLVIGFTYLSNYTLLWKPYTDRDKSLAEYLKTEGNSAFITGVRPGQQTAIYLAKVMARITCPAALILAFLAAGLPYVLFKFTGQNQAAVVLAEMIFVKSALAVWERFNYYKVVSQPYEGLLKKRA